MSNNLEVSTLGYKGKVGTFDLDILEIHKDEAKAKPVSPKIQWKES